MAGPDAAATSDGRPEQAAPPSHLAASRPRRGLGGHSLDLLRVAASVAPVVYVWLLPFLANFEVAPKVTFAHRCEGFPSCRGSRSGQSLANLLDTPQATGMMMATCFFPLLHLWLPRAVIEGEPWTFRSLVLVQLLGPLCLVTGPSFRQHPGAQTVPQAAFAVAAMVHFYLMLRHCREDRLTICRAFYVGLSICNGIGLIVVPASILATQFFQENLPWCRYVLEALSVSCMVLFILFWHRDRPLARNVVAVAAPEDADPLSSLTVGPGGGSFISLGNSTPWLKVLGTVCPILYIWSLPLLASFGTFVNVCKDFPYCTDLDGHASGESVSDMICTPQATGMMGACFFWPTMHLWMPGAQAPGNRLAYILLIVFQVCYGLFLCAPVIYLPTLHFTVVTAFSVAGVAHLSLTLQYCWAGRFVWCAACLGVADTMLVWLVLLTLVDFFDPYFFGRSLFKAWCFYACEATGLSAIAAFPALWQRRKMHRGYEASASLLTLQH